MRLFQRNKVSPLLSPRQLVALSLIIIYGYPYIKGERDMCCPYIYIGYETEA